MLASFDEAEDAVQETFLRAWRSRERVRGRLAVPGVAVPHRDQRLPGPAPEQVAARARCCTRSPRCRGCSRTRTGCSTSSSPTEDEPDAVVVERETIELAFLAALQVLPPRQRAALILRDVLGQPAAETASLLDTSVAAANSALQRARATMQEHLPVAPARVVGVGAERGRADAAGAVHRRARAMRRRGRRRDRVEGHPHHDAAVPVLLRRAGRHRAPSLETAFGAERDGDWRLVPTMANRMPTAASYLRRPGDTEFRAFKLDVLRIEDGTIAEITTFGAALFPRFGLPPTL